MVRVERKEKNINYESHTGCWVKTWGTSLSDQMIACGWILHVMPMIQTLYLVPAYPKSQDTQILFRHSPGTVAKNRSVQPIIFYLKWAYRVRDQALGPLLRYCCAVVSLLPSISDASGYFCWD